MNDDEIRIGMCSLGVLQTCYKLGICNIRSHYIYKRSLFEICCIQYISAILYKRDMLLFRFNLLYTRHSEQFSSIFRFFIFVDKDAAAAVGSRWEDICANIP